ncbi:hypothetical protein M434DRAFT_389716 [Hypoxylon sp. CO27-5]|nr:hypothetical protein M434DRAFT_389716 [Hypoxylon sp. CO27-5]
MSLAPAVTRDGFSYAGDLFAEASGHNRHRRATVAELKDHFKNGSDKDHPAHWFEAQLIHYGLQPSKTKSSELKKEWTKNEREAKKAIKDVSSPAVKSSKRKAEASTVDLTLNVGGINITLSANSATKKTKTTATPTTKSATPSKTPKATPKTTTLKPKSSQKRGTSAPPSSSASTSATPTARKQTARRGGIHQGPGRGSATAASSSPQRRPIQTARRGRGWQSRGPTSSPARAPSRVKEAPDDDWLDDIKPPPYSQYADDDYGSDDRSDDGDGDDMELRPLGLLNGRYDIECPYATVEWGHRNLELILTLSGSQLWGRFDLGAVSGVLRLDERPWQSSHEALEFKWRGRELEGPMVYGDRNVGWIKFLGDGRIEGQIDFMDLQFSGNRVAGQGTRSEVDAAAMRNEWDGYNEREYEREERDRWF